MNNNNNNNNPELYTSFKEKGINETKIFFFCCSEAGN